MDKLFCFMQHDAKMNLVIFFTCCIFIIIASLLDMWTALEAVRAGHKRPKSRPLMKTGQKIIDYFRLILFVLMVDIIGLMCFSFYAAPYCVVFITIGILAREGLSMKENYELKKSKAIEAVELTKKIVECLTEDDAKKLLKSINKRTKNEKNR